MLEREVDPMSNPGEDTSVLKWRTIQAKKAASERKSRRHCNCDVVVPEPIVDVATNTRYFNSLMVKGWHGGRQRIKFPKTKEWNHFPNSKYKTTYCKLLPVHERIKRNENAFTSVREDTCQAKNIVSIKEKETKERGTRRICNLSKLEHCLNDKLSCKCHVNDVVENFI